MKRREFLKAIAAVSTGIINIPLLEMDTPNKTPYKAWKIINQEQEINLSCVVDCGHFGYKPDDEVIVNCDNKTFRGRISDINVNAGVIDIYLLIEENQNV